MLDRILDIIAHALREYRRRTGLSQEQAALEIGCSVPTYRALEVPYINRDRMPNPKLGTVMRALATVGIDAAFVDSLAIQVIDKRQAPNTLPNHE